MARVYSFGDTHTCEEEEEREREKSWKVKVISTVLCEERVVRVKKKILDPEGQTIRRWNKFFLIPCLVSLFADPMIFFVPTVRQELCIDIGIPLQLTLTVIRSITDVFYIIQILVRFRTAYVAPSSRVFGRGELVIDTKKIALRYLGNSFWIDLINALPLSQVLIWGVIPNLSSSTTIYTKNALRFIIVFQYLPRLFIIFPLSLQIAKAAGAVTQTAWVGAAYNLILYMLASHVLGAGWYLLSIQRQESCWISACDLEQPSCEYGFFECQKADDPNRDTWLQSTNVSNLCDPSNNFYQFGMYGVALSTFLTSAKFLNKYFYCMSWGVRNLSSFGQNLMTSAYLGEIMYAILVGFLGIFLFTMLIGNMQTYLQSTTVRLEEWRKKITDTEQWMHHRQLPQELRQSIRKFNKFKWVSTRGVDEEALLKALPMNLRRDIKRYLCLDLVRRVPLIDEMDERMLDTICERLKPALCTEGRFLVREGDPVNEMLFIIRGHLDSYTTNGGRSGFFNSCQIGPGDFCGEELLTWALDPRPNVILPSSTRTVKSISQVGAFALRAQDLKFVASQFPRLRTKELRRKFRFYSQQWRTWAACFIQVAWRRFQKRKDPMATAVPLQTQGSGSGSGSAGWALYYAARQLVSSSRRGAINLCGSEFDVVSSSPKPTEIDFPWDERNEGATWP